MEILNTVFEEWEAIMAFLFALHAAALVVVNYTSTPADDRILAKAYRVLEIMAGIGRKAKELPGEKLD